MKFRGILSILLTLVLVAMIMSCKPKEQEVLKEGGEVKPVATQEATPEAARQEPAAVAASTAKPAGEQPATAAAAAASPEKPVAQQPAAPATDIALEVNTKKLKKSVLQNQVDQRYQAMKANVPKGQEKEAKAAIRKEIINDFILRTVLAEEADRLKIFASVKEVDEGFNRFEKSLPQGVTLKDVLKMNRITKEKIREDLQLGIRVGKLLEQRTGGGKPSDKEVADFYEKNIESFKIPESVKARHILVATATGDDDTVKKEKRQKVDNIRKQLLDGADFAQLAASSSDCPSKESGGDLGTFNRGQMVKAFEDAAFSQKINEIGQVVETEFGYHIIQVSEKNSAKTTPLDDETKKRIAAHLQQEKQRADFAVLLEQLRAKAKIVLH